MSFVATAQTALRMLGNPEIARLTAKNEVDFVGLRARKTVFYLIVPQEQLGFYVFLLNLFYGQFFQFALSSREPGQLPIYLLLDEFGHLKIPNFETVIATIRKYKVSVSIILQSLGLLEAKYGKA